MAERPDHKALLQSYRRYRKVVERVMVPVGRLVDAAMLGQAAAELGLVVDGELLLTGDHDLAAVLDYAMHELRADGRTVIQRRLAEHPPDPGSRDDRVLRALDSARYSVFLIDGIEPIGMHVHDMLGGPARFVVDEAFTDPALLGERFAGRLVSIDDVTMSTGVFLPLDQLAAGDILDELIDHFPGRAVDDLHGLSPEDQTIVTTVIARAGLEATDWLVEQALLEEAGLDPLSALGPDDEELPPIPMLFPASPSSPKPKKKGKRR